MMLTTEILQAGTGCNVPRAANWLDPLDAACGIFAIDSPIRLAAFLAQVGHESGRLVYVHELWGPTPAQLRYDGRADLGNTQPGDGKRFLGRGLIQLTGRANAANCRDGLREYLPDVPDFEAAPEQLEVPRWAALSAAWFWQSHGCNAIADSGDFARLTRRINGGLNGFDQRLALYEDARAALGVAA